MAPAAPAQVLPQVLHLQEALAIARAQQPQARIAQAQRQVMHARAAQSRAALLPQVSGVAEYERVTANYVQRPGALPSNISVQSTQSRGTSYNFFILQGSLNQLVYDFGATLDAYRSARRTASAQDHNARAVQLVLDYNLRQAYFAAYAAYALVQVGQQNVANIQKHLRQIEADIAAGIRAEIDLASARNDVANARVTLIGYENTALSNKLLLNQAMGIEAALTYEVTDEAMAAVQGEDSQDDALLQEALRSRPEFAQMEQQVQAQALKVSSARGQYFPSLSVQANVTDQGSHIKKLAYNWTAMAMLSWNLASGGLNYYQVDEAQATLASLRASRDAFRQQVLVNVENARLAIRASKQTVQAAQDSLANAEQLLAYADGRYSTGVGSIIELGDAQVARSTAAAQLVQGHYQLAAARAGLLMAVGRFDS